MPDIKKIVDTKSATKVGGVMLDMFTASMILTVYDKVNDQNKGRMEKSNIQTLVHIAHKVMGVKESLAEIKLRDVDGITEVISDEPDAEHDQVPAPTPTELDENADMVLHVDDKLQANLVVKMAGKFGLKSKKTKISWSGKDGVVVSGDSNKLKQFMSSVEKVFKEETVSEAMKIKDIFRKHKREITKAYKSGDLSFMSPAARKAEDDLMQWAMDNGEVKTDDPDDFFDWLSRDLEDIVKGKIKEDVSEKFSPYNDKQYPRCVDFYIQFRGGKGDRITSEENKKDYETAKKMIDTYCRTNKIKQKPVYSTPMEGSSAYKVGLMIDKTYSKTDDYDKGVDLQPLYVALSKLKTAEDHGGGWDKLAEETFNSPIQENYRKLAKHGMGTETPKSIKVGTEIDYYQKDGAKYMGKVTKMSRQSYTVRDDKTKKDHEFFYHDRIKAAKLLKQGDNISEKVEYAEYKFKNKRDAQKALDYFKSQQQIDLDINDDGLSQFELTIDAGKNDMTKQHKEVMKMLKPKVMTQEAVSPAQQAAIAIDRKEKRSKGAYKNVMDSYRQMWQDASIEEGKYLKYSNLLLKKAKEMEAIDKAQNKSKVKNPSLNALKAINKEIEAEMKKLGIKESINEEMITYRVKKMQKPEEQKFTRSAKMMGLKITMDKGKDDTVIVMSGTKKKLRDFDAIARGKSSFGDPSTITHFDEK